MSWWEDDPRYGAAGWTLIHPSDGGRPYFVQAERRKRRQTPRALRFGEVKPGDVLIHSLKVRSEQFVQPFIEGTANDNRRLQVVTHHGAAIVTHRWFDPVWGQDDPLRGNFVGIAYVGAQGLYSNLRQHSIRGLASQGYNYATPEQAAGVHAFCAERAEVKRAYEAKELTAAEARMRWEPWDAFLRRMGLTDT